MELVTKRFLLRDFMQGDAPAFEAYHADPRSLEFYGAEARYTMNYVNTFIQVAPDTAARKSAVPGPKAGKKSIAVFEYELISEKPYTYTQEEVQFIVHTQRAKASRLSN